jgi:hypothetical protein
VLTKVINKVSDANVGLGPIEFLLKDPEVTEVGAGGQAEIGGRPILGAPNPVDHVRRSLIDRDSFGRGGLGLPL